MTPAVTLHRLPPALPASFPDDPSADREALFARLAHQLGAWSARRTSSDAEAEVAAWDRIVAELTGRDPAFWDVPSPVHPGRSLEEDAAREAGLHPDTLHRSLALALSGHESTASDRSMGPSGIPCPALAVLAANIPVLVAQVLRPALLRGRPLVLKVSSRAAALPLALVDRLLALAPSRAGGLAALCWPGGGPLDEALLGRSGDRFDPVIVYGDASTVARYRALASARVELIGLGPATSVGLIRDRGEPSPSWLAGVARDVAVFDQRGCLSLSALVLVGDRSLGARRAAELATTLHRLAESLPVARSPADGSAARQWLDAAILSGRQVFGDLAAGGAVVLGRGPERVPGGRCVALSVTDGPEQAVELLSPLAGSLQGVALAGFGGAIGRGIEESLRRLGATRVTAPGRLQATPPRWPNGGVDLHAIL